MLGCKVTIVAPAHSTSGMWVYRVPE